MEGKKRRRKEGKKELLLFALIQPWSSCENGQVSFAYALLILATIKNQI